MEGNMARLESSLLFLIMGTSVDESNGQKLHKCLLRTIDFMDETSKLLIFFYFYRQVQSFALP